MDIIIEKVRETREEIKKLNEKNDEFFNKNRESQIYIKFIDG